MAPGLSLSKVVLDSIRESVSLAVVSIWQIDESSGSKTSFRSGFLIHHEADICIVFTLRKDLNLKRQTCVRFENGQCFEGFINSGMGCMEDSNLAAISMGGLTFQPKSLSLSKDNAKKGDIVVHIGLFDQDKAKLNFSSGMVGVTGHNNIKIHNETFTRFDHCCSQKLHLIGGPVVSVSSELVGVNFSQRVGKKGVGKNLFFAMDVEQLRKEFLLLLGKDMEHLPAMIRRVDEERRAKLKRKR